MPFWLKLCPGFFEPNLCEKPTHPHQGRRSWRPNHRRRSQRSSRRTWQSCTSGKGNPLGRPGPPRRLWAHRDTSRWKTWRIAGTPQRRLGRMESRDLGFRDGENGFNAQTSAFTAMRLLQAVRVAANLVRGGNQGDHPAGQAGPTKAPVLCDRRQLEDAYVAMHGPDGRSRAPGKCCSRRTSPRPTGE